MTIEETYFRATFSKFLGISILFLLKNYEGIKQHNLFRRAFMFIYIYIYILYFNIKILENILVTYLISSSSSPPKNLQKHIGFRIRNFAMGSNDASAFIPLFLEVSSFFCCWSFKHQQRYKIRMFEKITTARLPSMANVPKPLTINPPHFPPNPSLGTKK